MEKLLKDKKLYSPPEFEYLFVKLNESVLGVSSDANTDHNDPGGGLLDDPTNPDINSDYYDLGDGDW